MTVRIILDLRGLVIQSFYSGEPEATVRNEKGELVASAAHGVKKFIDRYLSPLLETYAPINIIGVLEGSNGNLRRRTLLSSYKEKPAQDADDKVKTEQRDIAFEQVQKLMLGLGCPLVRTSFAEADDTIAYLCQRLKGGKIVYTVDKDLTALHAHDTVIMVDRVHTHWFKGMDFESGVPTSMVTLYKSIVGDSSDNYNGVKGLGEKAWETLVANYGYDGMLELEQCVKTMNFTMIEESLKSGPDKLLQKLLDARSEWRMSYTIASLHPEWCETSWQSKYVRPQWVKRVPEYSRILKVLTPLGLEPLAAQFQKWCIRRIPIDLPAFKKLNLQNMARQMRNSPCIAFDYESADTVKHPKFREVRKDYVDVLSQKITGISFAFGDNMQYSIYISFEHCDTENVPISELVPLFEMIDTEDQAGELVAHNASFEMTLTKTNLDYEFKRRVLDTRITASHVDENDELGLKKLSKSYLNYDQIKYEDVVNTAAGEDMRDVSLAEVLNYGCDDSICTAHLFVLHRLILECEETYDFAVTYESGFDPVMVPAFIAGIPIDYEKLKELELEDVALREKCRTELRELLEEHCLQINMEGFNVLWAEVEPYERNLLEDKVKADKLTRDALEDLILEKRKATYNVCKYVPLSVPDYSWNDKKAISAVAKNLGFPGVRSIKQDWVEKYCVGIRNQAKSQEFKLSEAQDEFLDLLLENAQVLSYADETDEHFKKLMDFCDAVMQSDTSLWEGDELNIDSPKQMAELFYGKMALPILIRNIDKTDDNRRSQWEMEQAPATSVIAVETWLAEINNEADWRYKVLKLILILRGVSTRFKLYYNPYPVFKHPKDGRIHPGIKNCGTKTRRPSGTSPNILQVSKKDEGKLRSCFLPLPNEDEPEIIISIDFVQQELVIMAGESGDTNLRACYVGNNKRDVHSSTGTAIYNVLNARKGIKATTYEDFCRLVKAEDKTAKAIRKKPAKITNFLTVYGGSAGGLARKATVPLEMATSFLEAFFSTYPKVADYQEKQTSFALRHGFVKSCFGTRKHCEAIFSKNKAIAASLGRQAGNFPIQGGAADVLKVVMHYIVKTMLLKETKATIYAPVYDELVASVPVSKAFEFIERLADIMEMALPGLDISLSTSVSVGLNWGDQIEIGTRPTLEEVEQTIDFLLYPENW